MNNYTLKAPVQCFYPRECICLKVDLAGVRCTRVGACPKGVDKTRVGRSVLE